MARAVTLIVAIITAGCSNDPVACTDLAQWRIDLSQGAPVALAIASDGSLYVAIGDSGDGVQLGSYSLFGAHIAHISDAGEILAVVPAHEGDGHLGPGAILLDRADNLFVDWRDDYRVTLARYSPHLDLRWTNDFAGLGREAVLDVAPTGESVLLTPDPQDRQRIYYVESTGDVRWSLPVDPYGITRVVFGTDANQIFGWIPGNDGALRYTIEGSSSFVIGTASFNNPPTLLRRDGGYISQTFDMLLRADGLGIETWYRAFAGPFIGVPIASTTGDVLLPSVTADGIRYVLLIDQDTGTTRAVRTRCASTLLGAADRTVYYGVGGGGDDPGSISRFPLR